jgi:hypothetical protein
MKEEKLNYYDKTLLVKRIHNMDKNILYLPLVLIPSFSYLFFYPILTEVPLWNLKFKCISHLPPHQNLIFSFAIIDNIQPFTAYIYTYHCIKTYFHVTLEQNNALQDFSHELPHSSNTGHFPHQ